MSRRVSATMTIWRPLLVNHGNGDVRDEEQEIEVEVTGEVCPAESDVGIFSPYCVDICATQDGRPIDLTEKEEEKAAEMLSAADDDCEDWDRD